MKDFKKNTVLIIGYCILQVLSNLTVAKTIPILMFSIPIGSILYAISFTWMDVSNHQLGIDKIKYLIKIMVIVNILIAIWLKLYIVLPTNDWNIDSFESNAINFVFGSYFRITFASVLAGYISGNTNANIFHFFKSKTNTPIYIWSVASNVVASFIDGIAFYVLAFAFSKPWNFVLVAALSSAIYKSVISLISVPSLYLLKRKSII